jgi:hypothetical protein
LRLTCVLPLAVAPVTNQQEAANSQSSELVTAIPKNQKLKTAKEREKYSVQIRSDLTEIFSDAKSDCSTEILIAC